MKGDKKVGSRQSQRSRVLKIFEQTRSDKSTPPLPPTLGISAAPGFFHKGLSEGSTVETMTIKHEYPSIFAAFAQILYNKPLGVEDTMDHTFQIDYLIDVCLSAVSVRCYFLKSALMDKIQDIFQDTTGSRVVGTGTIRSACSHQKDLQQDPHPPPPHIYQRKSYSDFHVFETEPTRKLCGGLIALHLAASRRASKVEDMFAEVSGVLQAMANYQNQITRKGYDTNVPDFM